VQHLQIERKQKKLIFNSPNTTYVCHSDGLISFEEFKQGWDQHFVPLDNQQLRTLFNRTKTSITKNNAAAGDLCTY
jgi:hypothetical protein